MSEADRLKVVQAVVNRMLRVAAAAKRIGVTPRQVARLLIGYKEIGPVGLTSRMRGKPSNHQLPAGLAEYAMELVRDRYSDFGPTLAREKLIHHVRQQLVGHHFFHRFVARSSRWVADPGATPGAPPAR